MTDRNRWDEDRGSRSNSSDYRDDEDERYRGSGRDYGNERQSSQQDCSGEFDRDLSWNDEASMRAGGSYRADYRSEDNGSRRTGSERYGSTASYAPGSHGRASG